MSDLEIPVRIGDFVHTKFGIGVMRGRYSNYTTAGVIVEIRGANYYLAEEAVRVHLPNTAHYPPLKRVA
jgi:hypothetical protein